MLAQADLTEDTFDEEEAIQKVAITVNGIEGYAESSSFGWGFHGNWASHTGYRHVHMSRVDQESVQHTAEALYEEQSVLCYLVGDEHKEFGWKKIRINLDGVVEVRLPQWASQIMKDTLTSIGLSQSCPLNCYWVFQKEVELNQAKEVLDPILQPNTRFADEKDLSSKLIENFPSSELGFKETQLSLF